MGKEFNFVHEYHKLRDDVFGAVRGATRNKQYKVGDIVVLKKNGQYWGDAEVLKIETGPINHLPVKWYRHLVSHGSFMPNTARDFMAYLNSIRHPKARLTSVMDEVAVFHLRKVRLTRGK